jgi:hypothetical protein
MLSLPQIMVGDIMSQHMWLGEITWQWDRKPESDTTYLQEFHLWFPFSCRKPGSNCPTLGANCLGGFSLSLTPVVSGQNSKGWSLKPFKSFQAWNETDWRGKEPPSWANSALLSRIRGVCIHLHSLLCKLEKFLNSCPIIQGDSRKGDLMKMTWRN